MTHFIKDQVAMQSLNFLKLFKSKLYALKSVWGWGREGGVMNSLG